MEKNRKKMEKNGKNAIFEIFDFGEKIGLFFKK